MSSNFLSLPREIRDPIYELVLLHQVPIGYRRKFDAFWNMRPVLTPGLLRASKTIHGEANSLFYSRNRFDLRGDTPEAAASFFSQIGKNNADLIQHIHVSFPEYYCLEPGEVIVDPKVIGTLENIQRACAYVHTITTHVFSICFIKTTLSVQDNLGVATESLELINTHFRAICPQGRIIAEIDDTNALRPNDHERREMERHGWTIVITHSWDSVRMKLDKRRNA